MSRKLKYGILTIGLLILIGFALKGRVTHEKFDSEKWKNWAESETEWSLRWDMMNSLRNEKELIGKSYEEIITILGKPDNESKTELYYSLGYN